LLLVACATIQFFSSPIFPFLYKLRHRLPAYLYVSAIIFNLFAFPLLFALFIILIVRSRKRRMHYWWAYVAGLTSLSIWGATAAYFGLLSGLSRGP
jgi:hypothetical protein